MPNKGAGAKGSRTKVTIRDVAAAAGVSPSTVSRAFARPDRVSAETSQLIFDAAEALGYHSEPVKTVPSREVKHLIGVIVPDVSNQFFSDLIRSVQQRCMQSGVTLIIHESRESASLEREAFDRMAPHVDGVILASSRMPDAMIRKCAQTRPTVVTNRQVRGVGSVVFDVSGGVRQLVDYMSSAGFGTVTYLDGPAMSWSVGVRWNAFSRACAKAGISATRLWPGSPTFEGGFAFAQRYMEHPTPMVVAHNDLMAVGFMAAMRQLGMECPKDYSIAGFDNDAVAQITKPSLTTIRQQSTQLGAKAADILLTRLRDGRADAQVITVPTTLIVRESTQRL